MNTRFHYKSLAVQFFALALFACTVFMAPAFAQTSFTASDISLELSPNVPVPNQPVTITLSSYSVDLDKAQMVWREDNEIKSNGTGIKSYIVTAGDVGSSTTVSVSIIVDSTSRFDKKVVITPSEVDMMWEATDSYVPPFYEGKALPSSEATIKVVAVPQTKAADYVYSWKRNFIANQGGSGFSKNTMTFRTSYLNKQEDISVSVSPTNGQGGGEGRLTIVTGKPKIVFYEESPLEGTLLAQALNNGYRLTNPEAVIVAEPYFFSSSSKGIYDISYTWALNNNKIDTPSPANILVIRGGQSGRAKVDLKLESISKLFQTANASFFVDIVK